MNFDLPVLAPSILAADFTQLGNNIKDAVKGGANWIHCDIMDGHFVPNISFGPNVVKATKKSAPNAFIDVHLMIENPDEYIEDFAEAGADLISVHYETCPHLHRTVQHIKQFGVMAGVVVNPATQLHLLEDIFAYADLILVMSVNPGFGGQSFIESSYQKLEKLAEMREKSGYSFLIQVDGGVNPGNIKKVAESGADVLVSGNSVFSAENISLRVEELIDRISG